MSACQLNQHKHSYNEQCNPPVEEFPNKKQENDAYRKCQKNALPKRNRRDFSRIPYVPGKESPEGNKEDRSDGAYREKNGNEECRECLSGSRQRTYTEEDDQKRRYGEDGGYGDPEGEGRHGKIVPVHDPSCAIKEAHQEWCAGIIRCFSEIPPAP
ncbi:MAG: hypothetical protein Greene101449_626 [Candidatus Peregrinibacteria bacterium Greene1014_49]|nr:MAG: hypothetical protein Greene101449_626 [Candidatus Peregrinibacteria bacterium Greene1014_49]